MVRIELYEGENIKSALRRLKKACEKENLAKDIKRHEEYEKPSQRNKRKEAKRLKSIYNYTHDK